MRRAALTVVTLASWLGAPRSAAAECTAAAPCVHAEPMWLTPAPRELSLVSAPEPVAEGTVDASAVIGFRLRPALVNVPAPNRSGRDVNALRHATDLTLAARGGIGNGLELTLVMPAGLYQRGAGIKGVTHQKAPAIAEQALHDPRVGFGLALPRLIDPLRSKLRLELKLPLGSARALAGEGRPVVSPTLAIGAGESGGGAFAGAELGVRLRIPSELFGSRIGSQAVLALGAGYSLRRPRLTFAAEAYALPSLVRAARTSYLPAEWLVSTAFSPASGFSFGLAGGGGLPLSHDDRGWFAGFGVPALRALAFARLAPRATP